MKKRNQSTQILLYIYGAIITLLGLTSFISEGLTLPGAYKLFSLTWIPLLTAYWLWVFKKQIGVAIYWKVAAFGVVIIDTILNFIIMPFIIAPMTSAEFDAAGSSLTLPDDPFMTSLLILLPIAIISTYVALIVPLYVVAFLYAFQKEKPKKTPKK